MVRRKTFLLLLAGFSAMLSASAAASSWVGLYGGPRDEAAWAVVTVREGGYVLAGATDSAGAGMMDLLLIRLDPQGAVLWQKTMGGPLDDEAYGAIETADGGFAVAGVSYNFATSGSTGYARPWLIRLASDGTILWQKTYDRPSASFARTLVQTSDGGFALAGSWWDATLSPTGFEHPYVIKTDASGELQWQKAYGDPQTASNTDGSLSGITQLEDGGYAVAGNYGQGAWPNYGTYVGRLTASGDILWHKILSIGGGPTVSRVCTANDGGLLLATGHGAAVAKFRLDGSLAWMTRFKTGEFADLGSVFVAPQGGYFVAGNYICDAPDACVNVDGRGPWLLKLAEGGDVEWEKSMSADAFPFSPAMLTCALDLDGGVLLGGYLGTLDFRGTEVLAIKTDADGNFGDPCRGFWPRTTALVPDPFGILDAQGVPWDAGAVARDVSVLSQPCALEDLHSLCPVIHEVQILQNPFRLRILGDNFADHFDVLVNGTRVPCTVKSSHEAIAKKGVALKAFFPKGQAVCVQVGWQYAQIPVNAYLSECFSFAR